MRLIDELIALDAATKPRVLLWDIETAPILGWAWEQFDTNLAAVEQDSYLLCYAWKWLDTRTIRWVGLPDTPGYKPGDRDDRWLAGELWTLLDTADWVIAHNGDRFDRRKAQTRFAHHGLPPPHSYQTIDTLKEARRYFNMPSHSLGELGRAFLDIEKEPHEGIRLWRGCMDGEEAAWRKMRRYNKRDVQLLEHVYTILQPWLGSPGHTTPNMNLWSQGERVCPKCGSRDLTMIGTFRRTHEYQEWRCGNCGGTSRSRLRREETKGTEPRNV
jgi:hypothetical protein